MLAWLPSIFSTVGGIFSGIFKLKSQQADIVSQSIGTLGTVVGADAQQSEAASNAVAALYSNGGFLERNWRPALMWICMFLVVSRWFGYAPGHISQEELMRIYDWLDIGLIGFLPLRSFDKWMRGMQISKIVTAFIQKKIV